MPSTSAARKPVTPTRALDPARLRGWCAARQGLGSPLAGCTPAQVLERTGWLRSVGGASPYLALFARAGLGREAVDRALTAVEVHELPSARGCTYVVPANDYALALRAGQGHGDEAQIAQAKKYLGVTDAELDRLAGRVLDALDRGPLDPAAIKDAVGDAVRSLGDAGKKRGTGSTLPLALGRLQSHGEIRRVPINGRLDQQRYRYARWATNPLSGRSLTDDALAHGLAERFFRWAGVGTAAQLAWWSGLGVRAAKAAMAALDLVPLGDGTERMVFRADRDELLAFEPAQSEGAAGARASLVGSLDNIVHLRRELATVLDEGDAGVEVLGDKGLIQVGNLADLAYHAIVEGGRLVGLWDWDGLEGRLVARTFGAPSAAVREAAARVEDFVSRELGDARSFSLDSPDRRSERIAALESLGRPVRGPMSAR